LLSATQTTLWPDPIDITLAVGLAWVFSRTAPVLRAVFDRNYRVGGPSLRAGLAGLAIGVPAVVVAALVSDCVQVWPESVSVLLIPTVGFIGGLVWPALRRLFGKAERLDDTPAVLGEFTGLVVGLVFFIVHA
jgi:hypothetical protein